MKKTKNTNANILVVGDLHLGVKRDDNWIYEYQYEALTKVANYAKENSINTIVFTGDVFDVRNSITQITMNRIRTQVMPLFEEFHIIAIVGNHDLKHRERIQPNSLDEILGYYHNVTVVNTPTTIMVDGTVPMDFIPWICNENRELVNEFIKESKSKFCVGHFELTGYYFYTGLKSSGMENDFLSNYAQVFSGHYHTISTGDNVLYVGTPYTLTTGDANDKRGVWDVELSADGTCDYHFIENDIMNHVKIQFDADTFTAQDAQQYTNKHVDVNIIKRDSSKQKMNVNIMEQLLLDSGVHSLKITDTINYDGIELVNGDDVIIKDNRVLVDEYINQLECDAENKVQIKKLFETMFYEAVKLKAEVKS